jgi:hypothetical protein
MADSAINQTTDTPLPYEPGIRYAKSYSAETLAERLKQDPFLNHQYRYCLGWFTAILKAASLPDPVQLEAQERFEKWQEHARIAAEEEVRKAKRSNLKVVPIREGE